MTFLRSASVLALVSLALSARAVLVDFEDLGSQELDHYPNLTGYGTSVVSRGFRLSGVALFSFLPSATAFGGNYSGSVALFNGDTSTVITLTKEGGGAFAVRSLRASSAFAFDPTGPITFTGARAGGGTVTQTFDVTAGSTTLQTLTFSGFEDVTSLSFTQPGRALQIDDISVAPVPEPASMAAVGLGAVAVLRRRKRA